METKIKANLTGDTLKLGADIITLADETKSYLETDDLKSFNEYALKQAPLDIYVGEKGSRAYRPEKTYYNTRPVAIYNFSLHPLVKILAEINGKSLSLQNFTQLLERIKKHLGPKGLALYSGIKDLKIQKILSIEHTGDKKGNFNFSVRAEKGKQDYEFPDSILLIVPILKFGEWVQQEIEFNFSFSWTVEEEGKVNLMFILENMELNEIFLELRERLIREKLSNDKFTIYVGAYNIEKLTDDYKVKLNPLPQITSGVAVSPRGY